MADKNGNQGIWDAYWSGDEEHTWWKHAAPEVMEFIARQSPEERPEVLDLGCGLGRHAIAFAQAGFRVTATDASKSALSQLSQRADELSLSIRNEVCDVLGDSFPEEAFDIVMSYNVIYHGRREQFAAAVGHVRSLLKRGGLFWFTAPTRQDGKYGFGEEVAPHTYLCEKSITPGDMHYFADEADLDEFLDGFRLISRTCEEGRWENQGEDLFYSNWQVVAEKV